MHPNFPLTAIHPHALHAAEAAEAADAQDRFWPMHDYLFAHQHELEDDQLVVPPIEQHGAIEVLRVAGGCVAAGGGVDTI